MKTRKIGSFLGLGAFALLGSPILLSIGHAQESLAGVSAASGIGATLGAAAAGSALNSARVPRGSSASNALIDEAGNAGAGTDDAGAAAKAEANTAPILVSPPVVESYGLDIGKTVAQLRATPSRASAKGGLPRQRESKVARQRRLARLSPSARKKAVQRRYKIPPRGWLSRYLPQDRYKFAKNWQFVSTEDSGYYFTPQALATRKFNPNLVIGFRTWQDAMLAGYKPDPFSKPEPAADIVALSYSGAAPQVLKYAEYLYSGQVSPTTHQSNMRYLTLVIKKVYAHPELRSQIPVVTTQVLGAYMGLNGIPQQVATKEYWLKVAQEKAEAEAAEKERAIQALNIMLNLSRQRRTLTISPWWDALGLFSSKVVLD